MMDHASGEAMRRKLSDLGFEVSGLGGWGCKVWRLWLFRHGNFLYLRANATQNTPSTVHVDASLNEFAGFGDLPAH